MDLFYLWFSSLYDLINSAFLTRKALHFSYIDAHKKSRENLGSNTLCYSRLYLTVLNDNKLPCVLDDNFQAVYRLSYGDYVPFRAIPSNFMEDSTVQI